MLCSLRAPAALTTTAGRRHLLRGSVDKESASSRRAVGLDPGAGKAFWADGSTLSASVSTRAASWEVRGLSSESPHVAIAVFLPYLP